MQETGNPENPRKKRGPKPFKPTPKQRKDVTLYAAGGMSEPGIAAEVGICQNTLRKHFAVELEAASQHEIANNLRRLRKAADKGNVTAIKHLDAKFEVVAAAASFAAPSPQPEDGRPATASGKPGKKELAAAAASTAGIGTEWQNDLETPPLPGVKPN